MNTLKIAYLIWLSKATPELYRSFIHTEDAAWLNEVWINVYRDNSIHYANGKCHLHAVIEHNQLHLNAVNIENIDPAKTQSNVIKYKGDCKISYNSINPSCLAIHRTCDLVKEFKGRSVVCCIHLMSRMMDTLIDLYNDIVVYDK